MYLLLFSLQLFLLIESQPLWWLGSWLYWYHYDPRRASLVARMVKNLPAVWETWVRSLGQEDPLEKGMATHSSILAWRIPWTEEPGRLQSMGSQRVRHDWTTNILSSQNFSSLNMHAFLIPSWLWISIFSPRKSPCYDSCQILNK